MIVIKYNIFEEFYLISIFREKTGKEVVFRVLKDSEKLKRLAKAIETVMVGKARDIQINSEFIKIVLV